MAKTDDEGGRSRGRDRRDDARRAGYRGERDEDRARYDREVSNRRSDDYRARSSHEPRREEEQLPELHAICKARVHSIKPFGIFVRLNDCRSQGLVHISQVSSYEVAKRDDPDESKVQALSAIFAPGEDVWVKIISLKREGNGTVKIGCSLKHVAQSDGRDLDPNHLQLQTQESREFKERPKSTLGAVYDVVCPRCGGRGHLKNECYATSGTVYELLPDEDPDVEQQETATAKETSPVQRQRQRPLPDSVSTVEEAEELIARLKAEKKAKKRARKEDKQRRHKKSKNH